jgi:sugar lactone lactonase YvrE
LFSAKKRNVFFIFTLPNNVTMKKILLFLAIAFCFHGKAQYGLITTYAGNGTQGYTGDGGQATNATLNAPAGLVFDTEGSLYISDESNHCVRKVTTSGVISTFAGVGTAGYSGDGGAATAAELDGPNGLAFDAVGNLYITDNLNNVIRKVNTAGVITTIAGVQSNCCVYYSGDGGQATDADIYIPSDVKIDAQGNIYIADYGNRRIRKINTLGIISTIAGNGIGTYTGDGGQATAATLHDAITLDIDASGNIYFTDIYNNCVRKINTAGIITTIVGNGTAGFSGDGGQATAARLNNPYGIALDAAGNIYISDSNTRIRKINTAGIISTVAGNGITSFSGNGIPAISTGIGWANVISFDGVGNLYIADGLYSHIFKVTACNTPVNLNITGTTNICKYTSTSLTVSGATTYTWSNQATTSSITVSPNSTTSYSVLGVSGNCGSADSINILVSPNLVISGTSTICPSTTATLTASGATSYTWSTNAGGGTTNSVIVSPLNDTVYSVVGLAGTCRDTVIHVMNVLKMTISTNPISHSICSGDSAILSVPSNCIQCTWSPGGATSYSIAVSPTTNTTYTAVGFVSTCPYIDGDISTINILPAPTVSYFLMQNPAPQVWDVYPTYSSNVASVSWNWGDTSVPTIGFYPSHAYPIAGKYNICVTVTDTAGCTATYCQNDSVYRESSNSIYNNMIAVNVFQGNQTTGVNQGTVNSNEVTLYPNPNNGNFIIETGNNTKPTMQLYDVNGKVVLSQIINNKITIDASHLEEGVYNLSIISNKGIVNKRLVIVR